MSPPRIVIVGAGISGLSAAYRLQQRLPQAQIITLEQAGRTGGTTWTLREQGYQVEIGPNGFLDTKPTTLSLCRELGLGAELRAASEAAGRNRYLFLDQQLKALPDGIGAFLRTDLLSWRGKLALLWERFRRPRVGRGDESIDAFARRRAGREAAELFADALVTGIYAGDPRLLSVQACFPRLAAMEQQHGSVLKGFAAAGRARRAAARAANANSARDAPAERSGTMWSLAGGLRVLIERLSERLSSPALRGVGIRSIRHDSAQPPAWTVLGSGEDCWQADAVLLTCPAHEQAAIVADLDPGMAEQIRAIAYNRIAVVALGYRRGEVPIALDGFGFIAPQASRRDVLGVQWCSSIFPGRAPEGCVLLRAMCGGWQRADMVDWDDARLLAALRAELRQAMRITAEPVFHRIVRWDRAIPQYHLGHLDRVRAIETRLAQHPGLYLGGNAYHGVALNDCTEQGSLLAERIAADLTGVLPQA